MSASVLVHVHRLLSFNPSVCLVCVSAKFQSCRRVCSNRYVFYMTERMLLRTVFHFRLNFEAEKE